MRVGGCFYQGTSGPRLPLAHSLQPNSPICFCTVKSRLVLPENLSMSKAGLWKCFPHQANMAMTTLPRENRENETGGLSGHSCDGYPTSDLSPDPPPEWRAAYHRPRNEGKQGERDTRREERAAVASQSCVGGAEGDSLRQEALSASSVSLSCGQNLILGVPRAAPGLEGFREMACGLFGHLEASSVETAYKHLLRGRCSLLARKHNSLPRRNVRPLGMRGAGSGLGRQQSRTDAAHHTPLLPSLPEDVWREPQLQSQERHPSRGTAGTSTQNWALWAPASITPAGRTPENIRRDSAEMKCFIQ